MNNCHSLVRKEKKGRRKNNFLSFFMSFSFYTDHSTEKNRQRNMTFVSFFFFFPIIQKKKIFFLLLIHKIQCENEWEIETVWLLDARPFKHVLVRRFRWKSSIIIIILICKISFSLISLHKYTNIFVWSISHVDNLKYNQKEKKVKRIGE